MLEKTEGAIKNGQSRDTSWQYWVHKTPEGDKQSKNTTQKTKKISNTDPTKNRYVNPGAREGLVPASYMTPTILLIRV